MIISWSLPILKFYDDPALQRNMQLHARARLKQAAVVLDAS